MDLRSYGRLLMRRRSVLASVFLLVLANAVVLGFLLPTVYTADTRMVLSARIPANASVEARLAAQQYLMDRMKTYAQLVTSDQVLQPVIDSLQLSVTVPELVKQLEITIPSGTSVIAVSAEASSAEQAGAIANVIAEQVPWAVAGLEDSSSVGDSPIDVSVLQPAEVPEFRRRQTIN